MSLLVRGNAKIHTSVLHFSLPPVKSCPSCENCRKTCYAVKLYRGYDNAKITWDRNFKLASDNIWVFHDIMGKELASSKEQVMRLHVSGDLYKQYYVDAWVDLIKESDKRFYVYTKVLEKLDLSELQNLDNINIIDSNADDGFLTMVMH